MKTGIIVNGKHSYKDYELTIYERNIGIPAKKKITKTIPYMNGSYDFSLLYGDQAYEEREIEYKFNLTGNNYIELNYKKSMILEWLMKGNKNKLYDDEMPGYYLMAECVSVTLEAKRMHYILSCKFNAYPFYISDEVVGNDIWDIFNFETDYATQNTFQISGTQNISIYNPSSINISPEVVCSSDIKITKNNINYFFKSGSTKDYRFKLDTGLNNFVASGNGNIKFNFRREIL